MQIARLTKDATLRHCTFIAQSLKKEFEFSEGHVVSVKIKIKAAGFCLRVFLALQSAQACQRYPKVFYG